MLTAQFSPAVFTCGAAAVVKDEQGSDPSGESDGIASCPFVVLGWNQRVKIKKIEANQDGSSERPEVFCYTLQITPECPAHSSFTMMRSNFSPTVSAMIKGSKPALRTGC